MVYIQVQTAWIKEAIRAQVDDEFTTLDSGNEAMDGERELRMFNRR